ncbi:TPA: hypothetical protein DD449_00385 [Candidatus Berkelbacteria bacterium]|uniref:Uncharacterized protein n=1 Tax=Berkelbacteria bacterium GW2011_GWE1_39_12 TaxID=1618337 RepID=A0A0G4B5F1_9BACT|nr:MAG: hypothetical protein UT28_C0001G1011 [Berkelbacteria bacterium GW2011_GWE1_39_12]HBO60131.1 hypothetical protein [Candidatus Berkelbacteria bacterium]
MAELLSLWKLWLLMVVLVIGTTIFKQHQVIGQFQAESEAMIKLSESYRAESFRVYNVEATTTDRVSRKGLSLNAIMAEDSTEKSKMADQVKNDLVNSAKWQDEYLRDKGTFLRYHAAQISLELAEKAFRSLQ